MYLSLSSFSCVHSPQAPISSLFPYTTLFRSRAVSVSDQKRIKNIFYDAWHFSGRSYLCRKRIGGCFQAWFENRNEICLSSKTIRTGYSPSGKSPDRLSDTPDASVSSFGENICAPLRIGGSDEPICPCARRCGQTRA